MRAISFRLTLWTYLLFRFFALIIFGKSSCMFSTTDVVAKHLEMFLGPKHICAPILKIQEFRCLPNSCEMLWS
jgi:hypothetical protein